MTNHNQVYTPVMSNLQNVFTYAFVETAMYHFVFPKAEQYRPVNIAGKVCHCLACKRITEIKYKDNGVVYIEKRRLAAQQEIYALLGLDFQSEIQAEKLLYRQLGYCAYCAADVLQPVNDDFGQMLYNLCREIHLLDKQFAASSGDFMDDAVREWLKYAAGSGQLNGIELHNSSAVRELLSGVIIGSAALADFISDYQNRFNRLAEQVNAALSCIPADEFTAFVAKPLTVYDSMAPDIYNEYTILFPEDDTPDKEFYSKVPLAKTRVIVFLEQSRINSRAQLLQEFGFASRWVKWLEEYTAI